MLEYKKLSLMSVVGGSLLLTAYPFDVVQQALAASPQQDNLPPGKKTRAASLVASIALLLDDEITQDDSYSAVEETLLVVGAANGVLSNDQVDAGSSLTLLQDVQHGVLNLAQDGSFTYQPEFNFTGTDGFRYLLLKGNGDSMQADVSIIVENTDDGTPDAIDASFLIDGMGAYSGNASNNDTIIDAAEVVPVSDATTSLGGSISIMANGDFTYTAPVNLGLQTDTYVYSLEDLDGDTDTATLSFTVSAIADTQTPREVAENGVITTQITLIPANAVEYLQINSNQFTLAQLNLASTTPLEVDIEDFGDIRITNFDQSTGIVTLDYDPTGNSLDHSGIPPTEMVSLVFKSSNANTSVNAQLEINITDISPVAVDDARVILEGSSAIAGNAFWIAGSANGDNQDSLIDSPTPPESTSPVTDLNFGAVNGNVDSELASAYGSMIISSAGVYTYTLDNTNLDVQGLTTGESLTEVFTYEITDRDGSTDTANIEIIINGVDDPAPEIIIFDTNGPSIPGTRSVAENSTTTGSFILDNISTDATTMFEVRDGNNNLLTDDAQAIISNTVFNLSFGTFTITAYNGSSLNYSYDPTGTNQDHSAGDTSILDEISFSIANAEGESANATLGILVTDTSPTAAPDIGAVQEDSPFLAVGDVTTNDTQGADTAISVSLVGYNMVEQMVGIPFASSYGTLDLNSDGTYTFTLDNANPVVDALNLGQSLTETFNYTIVDTDGDTSSTTLTIIITGATDLP